MEPLNEMPIVRRINCYKVANDRAAGYIEICLSVLWWGLSVGIQAFTQYILEKMGDLEKVLN